LPKAKNTEEDYPLPSAKQHRFGYVVHDVSRMRRIVMDQAVAPLGLTRSQWSILATLSRSSSKGMMQAEIARQMDVGKVTIGGLVRRLETAGLIERGSDDADKRLKRVYITAKGYEVIRRMIVLADELYNDILEGITETDREIAEETLVKVRSNLKRMIEDNRRGRKAGEAK
jgi:MarR family transcriptional regulator, transcriptional regulator for hemolysin